MIYIVGYSFFALVTLIIFGYKYYKIKLIKNKNSCSFWEAIKTYAKTPVCQCDDNWTEVFSKSDDQMTSPAFSSLPGNIFHHRHYD